MIIKKCQMRVESYIDALVALWEDSVRNSHEFLSESDIVRLNPFVREGIKAIEVLLVAETEGKVVGFMGIEARKIEMLFISPQYFGAKIGTQLMEVAQEKYQVEFVDVNEQNPKAKAFYEARGFTVYDRTPFDEQGNAFPVLKMKIDRK